MSCRNAYPAKPTKDNTALDFYGLLWARIGYNWELMQYTGLHDKNGVEIYEGDIVRSFKPMVVRFGDAFYEGGYMHPGFYLEDGRGDQYEDWSFRWDLELEVIGNIYEHPELLEVE